MEYIGENCKVEGRLYLSSPIGLAPITQNQLYHLFQWLRVLLPRTGYFWQVI